MKNKKFQIFISSTYEDLKEEREAVQQEILQMQHFPIGMEMFSAGNSGQWEIIEDTIDSSDYYILIIGHRYGSLAEEGISYTEKEYDHAKKKKIPTLAFIRKRNAPVSNDKRDDDLEMNKKLELFIDKAKKNVCDFWTTKEELLNKILKALPKEFDRIERPGWIREDHSVVSKLEAELATCNEENRKLSEELKALKNKNEEIKPDICLVINDNVNLELELKSEEDFANLRNKFEMLYLSDVPFYAKTSVSQEDIDGYNNGLPSKEAINEYIKEMTDYLKMKNSEIVKNFRVENNGKAKANDIYITLRFPQEILVIKADDLNKLKVPKKPEMPVNPIKRAKKEYERKQNFIDSFMNKSIAMSSPVFLANDKLLYNVNRPFTKGAWLNKDNSITIRVISLMHTLSNTIDEEFALIPQKNGNYNVEVAIICNEWTEQKLYTIPILVK